MIIVCVEESTSERMTGTSKSSQRIIIACLQCNLEFFVPCQKKQERHGIFFMPAEKTTPLHCNCLRLSY